MLTLFTVPKPFRGHVGVIQKNAIQSWLRLRPACEIVLFGDDEGTAQIAAEFGVHHIADVSRNEHGTPLVNDLFEKAQRLASNGLLCYVNADILLLSDLLVAARRIPFRRFLMVGQRRDVDMDQPWDFGQLDWESRLREYTHIHGSLHSPDGIDYFVFTHGLWGTIPPFALGRIGWDNWMIYQARFWGVRVVDATQVVTATHQNHDYAHIPDGGLGFWIGPEAQRNLALAGDRNHLFTLRDATWVLGRRWLIPALTKEYRLRQGERYAVMGLEAHRQGQLRRAARFLVHAFCCRPSFLTNRKVISALVEFTLHGRLMSRYRSSRDKASRP